MRQPAEATQVGGLGVLEYLTHPRHHRTVQLHLDARQILACRADGPRRVTPRDGRHFGRTTGGTELSGVCGQPADISATGDVG